MRLVRPSESAAIARFGIAKATATKKSKEKEERVERRKKPLLEIQRLTGMVRHAARTSRAKHIKPFQ